MTMTTTLIVLLCAFTFCIGVLVGIIISEIIDIWAYKK